MPVADYAGETVGTNTPFEPAEAADRAVAGVVAGVPLGAAGAGYARFRAGRVAPQAAPEEALSEGSLNGATPAWMQAPIADTLESVGADQSQFSTPEKAAAAAARAQAAKDRGTGGTKTREFSVGEDGEAVSQFNRPERNPRDELKARIRQAESGGNDNARNGRSSASGRYQFTDATWAALGGDPARKNDPAEQDRLMDKLTSQNEASLHRAGLPANAGNLYQRTSSALKARFTHCTTRMRQSIQTCSSPTTHEGLDERAASNLGNSPDGRLPRSAADRRSLPL
jgi:hypothetical protein